MKKILKNLFGYRFVFQLVDLKRKYFPNRLQKEFKKIEETEISKRNHFYNSFIKSGDLCFDVGANLGNRIIPLLQIGAKVVAIEPQESCYKYLEYKFGKQIEIVKRGLGEAESVKDFHVSDYTVISSFSNDWINSVRDGRFKGKKWDKLVKVEMTTLDRLIEKYGLPVFIKIDVEGYEYEVLKGLSKKIKMISFEYTVPEQTNKLMDCISQLKTVNPNVMFNYSIGESMVFGSEEWLSVDKIKKKIGARDFANNGFGDIYAWDKG